MWFGKEPNSAESEHTSRIHSILIKETKSKSRVSFKLDMTEQCEGIESFIVRFEFTTKFAKLARRFACSRDRNLKPLYPQFLIGRQVAVVNENICCLRRLMMINNTNGNIFFQNKNPLFTIITRNIYKNYDKSLKNQKIH